MFLCECVTIGPDYCRQLIHQLAPERFEWNFRQVIFKLILVIVGWGISCEIAFRWLSLDITDDKSTLVQAVASYHQATSHYLNQCLPRSLMPITHNHHHHQSSSSIINHNRQYKSVFPGISSLIFTMGIPILAKQHIFTGMTPGCQQVL